MVYLITENQNEKLRKYSAVKSLVDSFDYKGLIKTEFDLKFNNEFGFYEIEPTFYIDYWRIPPGGRQLMNQLKSTMTSHLIERIEDFLGIHIVSHKSHIISYQS